MKLLYLAHKIRDPRGPWWMQEHIREAEGVSLRLWMMGAAVICPGKNTLWFDGAAPDDVWLNGDLEMISRCDAVVMSPNWVTSEGAKHEREFAVSKGVPVFDWATQQVQIARFIGGIEDPTIDVHA